LTKQFLLQNDVKLTGVCVNTVCFLAIKYILLVL